MQTFIILFQAHITNFYNLCQIHMKSTFSVFFRDFCSFGFQVSSKFCSLKKKKRQHTQNKQWLCEQQSQSNEISYRFMFCNQSSAPAAHSYFLSLLPTTLHPTTLPLLHFNVQPKHRLRLRCCTCCGWFASNWTDHTAVELSHGRNMSLTTTG